ncbi:hypothetical protein Daura_14460 [Dactylosporangium aurantiacum]|uniref:Uncharacterized protein n=1 Tax=Dactylosporangium aurantiacum TaxID=35754 RepID=A0A9Q9IKF6_9ACTN|nr:hypothetical protein [Dactylosporangium aurantiacum]MDG6108596.1 hypothetical protein [Dactylosporangium aurantiacum]UWZ57261.1 hypothetical protein Daura_14460 [Dactylosporangium aurantiacum]
MTDRTEATERLLRRLRSGAGVPPAARDPEPAELAVWRRMRDDPFLAECFTVTDDPPTVREYLADGHPGVARFLADVLWLGETVAGLPIGYWSAGAQTFAGAPVIFVDDEATVELVGTSLVDFLGRWVGELGAAELLDFCDRAGLRPPLPEAGREAALEHFPDPQQVFYFLVDGS